MDDNDDLTTGLEWLLLFGVAFLVMLIAASFDWPVQEWAKGLGL